MKKRRGEYGQCQFRKAQFFGGGEKIEIELKEETSINLASEKEEHKNRKEKEIC